MAKKQDQPEPAEHIDYMDVKAASEVSEELRRRTRRMLKEYREWRKWREAALMRSAHLSMQDDLMREQLKDMYGLYRATHGEFLGMYRRALAVHAVNDSAYMQQRKAGK